MVQAAAEAPAAVVVLAVAADAAKAFFYSARADEFQHLAVGA